jgi:hypothetical protein
VNNSFKPDSSDWASIFISWQRKKLVYVSIILFLNSAGGVYYIYYLIENGYLPSPFLYDKSNTFMDFFNFLYWAYDDGRYTNWSSVYPPLGFVILRVFNFVFAGAGYGDPELMRDNSQFVIAGVCLIYLAVPAIILKLKYWQSFSVIEKILTYLTILLSTPMLFTLERGNFILLSPILLAFALSKVGVARCLSIALLINLKPYFALLMIYYITRKNLKGFVTCCIMTGLIFSISGLVLDDRFLFFFKNLFNFAQEAELFSLREVMALPSSISAFSYVLKHPDGALFASGFLGTASISIIAFLVEAVKWSVLTISLVVVFMRSRLMRDAEVLALLVVIISNLGIWVGGYTYILYIVLIPVIIKMSKKWFYIGLISIIALPLDIVPLLGNFIGEQHSYLTDSSANIYWTLGLGSVIRPIVNLILLVYLSVEFLARKSESANTSI